MKIVQHKTALNTVIKLMEDGKEPWIIDLRYGYSNRNPIIIDPDSMNLSGIKERMNAKGVFIITFEEENDA